MPLALIFAFAASLGIHAAALFGPDFDLSTEPEPQVLMAELKPMPKSLVEPEKKIAKPATPKPKVYKPKAETVASETPVMSVPEDSPQEIPEPLADPAAAIPEELPVSPPVVSRLPERGRILYRVDRGDREFEIGRATSEWEIVDGSYLLKLVSETTGLVWLFRPYRIDMESRGRLTPDGLQPEYFSIQRNGTDSGEKATFDWEQKLIRVGNGEPQAMSPGAQDLLSFNYQLGFMEHPQIGSTLPITNGKKYGIYRLEVLGDEQIEIPAGPMRTLHLRAPGVNTTELWLAYDYLLLPVKIRHVDNKGNSSVQVATQIQLSPE